MNPKSTLTKAQIRQIFGQHNLALDPAIERITIGFSNEVYAVNNYILKVYSSKYGGNYRKEQAFYQSLAPKVMVPQLLIADDSRKIINHPYTIYQKIEGQSAGQIWHRLNDSQRRAIIGTFCRQNQLIRASESNPKLENAKSWQDHVLNNFDQRFKVVSEQKLLPQSLLEAVSAFRQSKMNALKQQNLRLTYWDINLDNLIINSDKKMVGLIDFEHVAVVSIDYTLMIVRQMMKYPAKYLSKAMEKHAKKQDYAQLLQWFREFDPPLFDFEQLPTRLDFYELEQLMRHRPRFPNSTHLLSQLERIVS